MNKAKSFLFLSTLFFAVLSGAAHAQDFSGADTKSLAAFFGVDEKRVHIECASKNFELTREDGRPVLNMCLHRIDGKRCEVAIGGLSKAPERNLISFEINFADPAPRKRWESVMQIHSFPDQGEEWRCPVSALEVDKNNFRMFNRWDKEQISRPVGYNCAGAGGSINSRTVLEKVPVLSGNWQPVDLMTRLTPDDDGEFRLKLDGMDSGLIKGPNIYNDKRQPFLKFGIYKPAGWEEGHDKSCVKYRNVKIRTGE